MRTCRTPFQPILLARDMGIMVLGFAKGGRFKVYSHERRVNYKPMYRE